MTDAPEPMDAVRALRARGIDSPEALLSHGTPAEILAACHRWDGRQGVGAGLLVKWIRDGEFDDPAAAPARSKGAILRARFAEYARRFPEGALAEPHATLIERQWPDDLERGDVCTGDMVVFDASYPTIAMECDECGFQAAIGARHLHLLAGEKVPF